MRVITRGRLKIFWELHPDAKGALEAWYAEVTRATWKTPNDVLNGKFNARTIPDNRVIFKINGNRYRLIVKIHCNTKIVYIRFIGTHAEYDRIDAETI
jgi:mRNA interferase HigB